MNRQLFRHHDTIGYLFVPGIKARVEHEAGGYLLRTNREGFEQLAGHLAELADDVIPVPLSLVLHLKSAVTALPDGTVVGLPEVVDHPEVYPEFLAVPEEHGGHVVLLGDDRLLMSTSAPQTAALFRDRGYDVVTVDISEYEKLEGCVTCLSVRLRG